MRMQRLSDELPARVEKMKALLQLLQENFADDVPWKDYILNCENKTEVTGTKMEPCVRFACSLVESRMAEYAMDPTNATKEKMEEISNNIGLDVNVIWSKKFLDFSFLSDDEKANTFESAVRSFYSERCTPQFLLFEQNKVKRVNSMVELIRQDRLLEALSLRFPWGPSHWI